MSKRQRKREGGSFIVNIVLKYGKSKWKACKVITFVLTLYRSMCMLKFSSCEFLFKAQLCVFSFPCDPKQWCTIGFLSMLFFFCLCGIGEFCLFFCIIQICCFHRAFTEFILTTSLKIQGTVTGNVLFVFSLYSVILPKSLKCLNT